MTRNEYNNLIEVSKMLQKEVVELMLEGGKRFESVLRRLKEVNQRIKNVAA